MRTVPKNLSIKEEGLKAYLDRTAEVHNGKGYDDFVAMLDSELDYTKTQIIVAFAISRPTIMKWLKIYKKEQRDDTN